MFKIKRNYAHWSMTFIGAWNVKQSLKFLTSFFSSENKIKKLTSLKHDVHWSMIQLVSLFLAESTHGFMLLWFLFILLWRHVTHLFLNLFLYSFMNSQQVVYGYNILLQLNIYKMRLFSILQFHVSAVWRPQSSVENRTEDHWVYVYV